MTILYKDYKTFSVLDKKVHLISDELDFGINTVAEIDGKYFYLGPEQANILAAIFAYQDMSGRSLTHEEIMQVSIDNNLASFAI